MLWRLLLKLCCVLKLIVYLDICMIIVRLIRIILFQFSHIFHGIWLTMTEILSYLELCGKIFIFQPLIRLFLNWSGIVVRQNTGLAMKPSLLYTRNVSYTKLWNWVHHQMPLQSIVILVIWYALKPELMLRTLITLTSKKFWQSVKYYCMSLPLTPCWWCSFYWKLC